ncbi:MAG: serine/threonine protein kinase [Solirubrobacteraceae bacterium]|nr:serine/threonine protein kinase [Solirubrobacteraceae bacterium]
MAPAPHAADTVAVGSRIGPYLLAGELGEGAVGQVFLARREGEDAPVALKLLKPEVAADAEVSRRFAHELRHAAAVRDRHLVGLLDHGDLDGRPYLVLPYLPGGSLAGRIERDGRLPVRDVVRTAVAVGRGLGALHAAGIVHRDVKTANVLLDADGRALLGDLGLARGTGDSRLTAVGRVVGTVEYLAPESLRTGEAGPPADVYALGCVAYACLVGRTPFAGRSFFDLAGAHLDEDPADPSLVRDDLPDGFAEATLTALAKDPARRPSATAYAGMLQVIADDTQEGR